MGIMYFINQLCEYYINIASKFVNKPCLSSQPFNHINQWCEYNAFLHFPNLFADDVTCILSLMDTYYCSMEILILFFFPMVVKHILILFALLCFSGLKVSCFVLSCRMELLFTHSSNRVCVLVNEFKFLQKLLLFVQLQYYLACCDNFICINICTSSFYFGL